MTSDDSIEVDTIGVSFKFNGLYNSFIIFSDFLFSQPITTRSGRIKSSIAEPSRKNSGFDTTSKFSWLTFSKIICLTCCVVPTGTVDLVTTRQYFLIF